MKWTEQKKQKPTANAVSLTTGVVASQSDGSLLEPHTDDESLESKLDAQDTAEAERRLVDPDDQTIPFVPLR